MNGSNPDVLVVDDDESVGFVLSAILEQAGYAAIHVPDASAARRVLSERSPATVITDLRMPGDDGLVLLRELARDRPEIPVIILTAHGTVADAVDAMKSGAADFLQKPFEREEVLHTLHKVLQLGKHARREPAQGASPLVGDAPVMQRLEARIERVAHSDATVLIRGESGTGKELVARAIHDLSPRRSRVFVAVHCAALPEHLLESELFGYVRGAFTGAARNKPGRLELAEGGTLFLDEIGDLPESMQVKLLRLLQERSYEPLGSNRPREADVRFIAATHRDLEAMVAAGSFREDLFYRLAVLPVSTPALRERSEDVPRLAQYFCERAAADAGHRHLQIEPAALRRLSGHPWPGNVRQLQSFVQRLVVLTSGATITCADVERELVADEDSGAAAAAAPTPPGPQLADSREQAERAAIVRALEEAGGNRSVAARLLGVSRQTLYNKLARHDIS